MEAEATEGANKRPREDAEGAEQTEETPSTGTAGLAADPEPKAEEPATKKMKAEVRALTTHGLNLRCLYHSASLGAGPETNKGGPWKDHGGMGRRSLKALKLAT